VLIPSLREASYTEAVRVGSAWLSYEQLAASATGVAARLAGLDRVAVWATPVLETIAGVVGALLAGAAAVPINPKLGPRELEHVVRDSRPRVVVAEPDATLPDALSGVPRVGVDLEPVSRPLPPEPDDQAPAFIFYTSGTTGPPKGVLVPRRAVTSNLDALAEVWAWTSADVLTHGLPLFHVHGLVLGVLGPLRTGGALRHVGRYSPLAVCRELDRGATMLFGVPTMYHELAEAAERDPRVGAALGGARLLVSGSAPLPVRDFHRIERMSGQRIVERYGLTETLMNCAVRSDGERRPGYVGPPLPGVDVRIVDEGGATVDPFDQKSIGEVMVRGPNLFIGYLNRSDATAKAMHDGWFRTGDLATGGPEGYVRIVGRRATDLIKTGGYKVGAGEVEAALLEHPAVAEAAVTGEPDERLGERIVAWVVLRSSVAPPPSAKDLEDHVASLIAPHKRPRDVRFLHALPRNEMGKVRKAALHDLPDPLALQPGQEAPSSVLERLRQDER
jgi:malonyl-CoA/methylmalonyl-CoA synthetase